MTSTASAELILRQIGVGDAGPVLVADFQAFTTAPRLSMLLSGRAHGRPVYQIDPIGALAHDRLYIPVPELAAASVGAFHASRPPSGHVFVVGHCTSAGLTLHIARLLESCRKVTAILVLPTWPDSEHIRVRFAEFQANIGVTNLPCPDLDGDPGRSVARMELILRDALATLAASHALDGSADVFSDLLAWYRGWLAFLLACQKDLPAERAPKAATVKVLAGSRGTVVVPGLDPDAYEICRMPILDGEDPVTSDVAELVIAQFNGSEPVPSRLS